MKTYIALSVVLVFAVAVPVQADDFSLVINGYAHHLQVPKGVKYNEHNTGLGFQYDFNKTKSGWVPFLTASGFKDSEYNMSYYAGGGAQYRFELAPSLDKLHFDAGAVAFLMTRKNFRDDQPFFGVLPAFTFGTSHVALNITYIPKVEPKMVPLWFFQLKIKAIEF